MKIQRQVHVHVVCVPVYFTFTGGVFSSDYGGPPYPKNVQSYWEIPRVFSYTFELGIFIMLGLSGE